MSEATKKHREGFLAMFCMLLMHLAHAPLWAWLTMTGGFGFCWALSVYADYLERKLHHDYPDIGPSAHQSNSEST